MTAIWLPSRTDPCPLPNVDQGSSSSPIACVSFGPVGKRSREIDAQHQDEPDQEKIATLRGDLALALSQGEAPAINTVLRELVDSIKVHDERLVRPRFRIPGAVRTRFSMAVPTGFEPVSPP